MNTRQLYYLVTIADSGSLTKAAQALKISPPALSKFLTEYEAMLGTALFVRSRRQLTPSAMGCRIIDCAHRILDEQNHMLLTMRAVAGKRQTVIRLGTAPNRGAVIYSRIYRQFSRRYPDISLQLTELYASEQPSAIDRGQIHLALGAGLSSKQVTEVPVAHEELLVAIPAIHPLARLTHIRLTDLRDIPFVLQGPRHSIRILAEQLFAETDFEPVIAFESDNVILIDSMLHQGAGVGFVSQAHVFPCKELVYLPLDPPVRQTLYLRYPLGHTLSEPERYLASLLIRERLGDQRYEAVHSPMADELFAVAEAGGETAASETLPLRTIPSTDSRSAHGIFFDSKILEYLIGIVDEKSLSRAADKFFLAQPALSRHLRNVEKTVGIPLFTRENNRLRPTNAGKVFVNSSRNILHIEAEIYACLRDCHEKEDGGQ